MEIVYVDDCVLYVDYQGRNLYNFYERNPGIDCDKNVQISNNPIVRLLSYELGEKIDIYMNDKYGEDASLSMTVYLNEYIIKTEHQIFWKCIDCEGDNGNYIYNGNTNRFDCVKGSNTNPRVFHFEFQIDDLSKLVEISDNGSSRLYYFLTSPKKVFKYITTFEEKIDLINNLNSFEVLYAIKDNEKIKPIYELLYFEIYFDDYFPSSFFKILSIDQNNHEIVLNAKTPYNIQINRLLRYKLQEKEKKKNGVHLKFKIRILDLHKNPTNIFEEFNFYICLKGYIICDADTYMKCLNEGYYHYSGEIYYSCYETCKTCDSLKKPDSANYINNYCDSCKEEYKYFVYITDDGNNFYKSCYRQCPMHAPYLKEENSIECLRECPIYKTNNKFCVDNCDYEVYKYLLKENETCYNYIPKDYSLYIDNYIELYDNSNIPLINIIDECPNDYDSSFMNYCINSNDDIYYLIPDPNELIEYHDPLIIPLETKNIIIRAYSSNSKSNDLKYYDNKLFKVDISECEKKLKDYYNIPQDESIITYDVNNIDNDYYKYKIFSSKGQELSPAICEENDINIIKYYSKKGLNRAKCPKEYPYYNSLNDKCIKYCDIDTYLYKTCITDLINTENKENNINYIKDSIKSYLIEPL